MASTREVYGPDGRRWRVAREPVGESALVRMLRREGWQVTAVAVEEPAEERRWTAESRATANALLEQVAMALRTGSEGPLQP